MRVLVCTDGSRFSEEAIETTGYLLRTINPEVTVLRVIPNIEEEYKEYDEYHRVFREEIHKLKKLGIPKSVKLSLEKGREILSKYEIQAELKTRKGNAAEEILKEAKEGNYNLIVVASYGAGISKFMLGSVSREVVHRSDRPVLVIKSSEGQNMM
jgi:nucleotide-binding universal stress UspA family protein